MSVVCRVGDGKKKSANAPTWRHVKRRAASVVVRPVIGGGQSKVGKLDGGAVVLDEDVLRLEIAMVDPQAVAMLDGVQDLEKDTLGEIVLAHILAALRDVLEEISLWAALEYHIDAVRVVNNLVHRHNVGVGRGEVVQADLAGLEVVLSAIQGGPIRVELAQALDGIADIVVQIDGRIHHSIRTRPQDAVELERRRQEAPQPLLGRYRDEALLARLLDGDVLELGGALLLICRRAWGSGISVRSDMLHDNGVLYPDAFSLSGLGLVLGLGLRLWVAGCSGGGAENKKTQDGKTRNGVLSSEHGAEEKMFLGRFPKVRETVRRKEPILKGWLGSPGKTDVE